MISNFLKRIFYSLKIETSLYEEIQNKNFTIFESITLAFLAGLSNALVYKKYFETLEISIVFPFLFLIIIWFFINWFLLSFIINFVGYKEDVRKCIDECDVFVLPSYHEGMPRSALEAMSMSKAMILSKIPGTKKLIKEDKNGFFCEPKSTDSLLKAVEKILVDRSRIQNFGDESRKIIEENFDDKIINNRLLEILDIDI